MNKLPFISCIALTYGRVDLLNEALACFLAQTYEGRKELIIFNSFKEQDLEFDHPEVRIINSPYRPFTIGETRNAAMRLAHGDFFVHWDDDDKFLPNHLSNFVRGFDMATDDWSWQSHQLFMDGEMISKITPGSPNVFAYTRKAWREVGGFHSQNIGEDQTLVGRITSKFKGVKVELPTKDISFLYHWGQGAYHISGQGDKGESDAMQRTEHFVKEQVKSGKMPTGRIQLVPKLYQDYRAMASAFIGGVTKLTEEKSGKLCAILLGRYGDIINILPVVRAMSLSLGEPIHFAVSKDFASVLDGVSYVIPEVLNMGYDRINEAVAACSKKFSNIGNMQVWGMNFSTDRLCSAYNIESWRVAGFVNEFNNLKGFPLVFDRRDKEREARLAERLPLAGKPVVLVNVSGGHSSPYSGARMFLESLQATWSHYFNVVDIADVKAERIYDLIGLFDRAAMLISSDTATIHLAAASDIPVIFLCNDNEWLSSATRCNVVLRLKYGEALGRMSEVNLTLKQLQINPNAWPRK